MLTALTRAAWYAKVLSRWRVKQALVLDYLPEDISVEVTNRCNFKCHFCPQSDPAHFERVAPAMLSPDGAGQILARLRRGGVRGDVMHWTLDGEPFVNKRFAEICGVAHDHGFLAQIFASNGVLATPARVAALPLQPEARYSIYVDFCSDEAYFETWRGTPGSFRQVLDNLRGLLDDPRLAHVEVQVGDISGYRVHDRAELARRFADLKALLPGARATFTQRQFHNWTGHLQDLAKPRSRRYHLCPYPWSSLVVASNGDVVACCRDLEHKTVLGNLFQAELGAIWNGSAYRALRQALVEQRPGDVAACRECDLPYDTTRFTIRYLAHTAIHRLKVFAP